MFGIILDFRSVRDQKFIVTHAAFDAATPVAEKPAGKKSRSSKRVPSAAKAPGAADKRFGTAGLRERRSAVLSVPSVLVPRTRNYLINPLHPSARRIKIVGLTDFTFDPGLLRGTGRG